ncbi:L-rhamnose mutarotase [Leucothrix mucor]|uniref:L-rhamnose mutarotase n=1 Tax=Leucothrix mucor TaxID=45248 RepID=UPI0003B41D9C|nr:L-rhamnose mutarotase [Leucothrix mucor]
MQQAFVMQLRAGFEAEYQQRHDEIWPELTALLKQYGFSHYSIYLHPETLQLFGTVTIPDDFNPELLKQELVMQRWWKCMAPLMETRAGSNEPASTELTRVFFML